VIFALHGWAKGHTSSYQSDEQLEEALHGDWIKYECGGILSVIRVEEYPKNLKEK
jgi:hypothetical protein